MRATTVKVEGELLQDLEKIKPAEQSLSAFVRAVLLREIQRQKMVEAGRRYAEFVRESPDEAGWLDAWERADLTSPSPARRR